MPAHFRSPHFGSSDIRALAARMITDDLVVIGVRHHSPACAMQVRKAVDTLRPHIVLVEGPRSFDPLIEHLTAPEAVAPLAVYSYLDPRGRHTGPRIGAYYPFADFSPELVALRSARAQSIPARFIDLDLGEQLVATSQANTSPSVLVDEHHLAWSTGLARLAAQLGCADHDDLWELIVEADAGAVDLEEHVARMTAYCLLARADATAESLRLDGTSAREAEMAWQVRAALDDPARSGPVLVVVGGFHAVVLPDLVADPPARPDLAGPSGRAVSPAHSALIRYGFDRIDKLSGYAAGIPAPGWQQRVWDAHDVPTTEGTGRGSPRVEATLQTLLDIADELMRAGHPVSQPELADAFAHTVQLAALRDHPSPLRRDLLDAIRATLVKGDLVTSGAAILDISHGVLTGRRVGTIPPGVAAPPLVDDVLQRLRRARLHVDTPVPAEVTLSIYRTPAHRTTSRMLFALTELDVPFADRTSGPDFVSGDRLDLTTERWSYRWSPVTEAALVEAARYGNTLPEAVDARFSERLAELTGARRVHDSEVAVELIISACRLGLHEHASRCLDAADGIVAADASFVRVARACGGLALVRLAREPLQAERVPGVGTLLRRVFERALYLGRSLPGEAAGEVLAGLVLLRDLTLGDGIVDADATQTLWRLVEYLSAEHPDSQVRGGALGLSYTAGHVDGHEAAARVAGALTGTLEAGAAVRFLLGLLTTAREIVWNIPDLVDSVGDLLVSWDEDQFLTHLPELRLAFTELTPGEIDRVASLIARRVGIDHHDVRISHGDAASTNEQMMANLAASQQVRTLFGADGLDSWLGAS